MAEQQQLILPTSEADRKKIMDAMQEISKSYTRIEGERAYIKEAIAELSEAFTLPKKALNKLSKVLHKGNFDQEAGQFEEFTELYESLVSATAQQKNP